MNTSVLLRYGFGDRGVMWPIKYSARAVFEGLLALLGITL